MRRAASCLALFVALFRPSAGGAAVLDVPAAFSTIQQAVDAAADGDVVQIAPGRYVGRVSLENFERSLTIRGNPADPSAVVLDGAGTTQSVVMIVNHAASLVLEGLTITGGHAQPSHGGGLSVLGSPSVLVRDCVVTGNRADENGGGALIVNSAGLFQRVEFRANASGYWGGGVLLDRESTTVFDQCRFVDNESNLTAPGGGGGGAVYVGNSSPIFVGCVVENNRAKFAGGGIWVQSAYGPSPYVVLLRDTTITGNVATRDPSVPAGSEGGGIHIENNSRVVLERCRVRANRSNRGGGLNSYRGRFEVTDSIIEDNVVTKDGTQEGNGGGLFASSFNPPGEAAGPAALVLRRTVVRRNVADTGGAIFIGGDFGSTQQRGILELHDSIVADNEAVSAGGGLYVDRSLVTIANSLLLDNESATYGGGALVGGSSSFTATDTTIAGNVAGDHGGGVFINQGGDLQLTRARVVGNRSMAGQFGGAGLYVGAGGGPLVGPPITGSVTDSVFADNAPGVHVVEDCGGDLSKVSAIRYTGNRISGASAGAGISVYWQPCSGLAATVSAFNALGAGKASANTASVAAFAHFLAAPGRVLGGTPAALGWAVAGVGGLTVDAGVGGLGAVRGNRDVTPAVSTTYTLSGAAGPLGTAAVEVLCAAVGVPVPSDPAPGSRDVQVRSVIRWHPATGAASYDVYLDTNAEPTTLVARDVPGTEVPVSGLTTGTTYRWRVVAKSGCADAATGPVASFTTCTGSTCDFTAGFDDGDLSAWTRVGKGTARVTDGRLVLTGKPKIALLAKGVNVGAGELRFSLAFPKGKGEARVLLWYENTKTYREIVVTARSQLRLLELTRRKARTRRRVKLAALGRGAFGVQVRIAGTNLRVFFNGGEVLSTNLGTARTGSIGLGATKGPVSIDDVTIGAR